MLTFYTDPIRSELQFGRKETKERRKKSVRMRAEPCSYRSTGPAVIGAKTKAQRITPLNTCLVIEISSPEVSWHSVPNVYLGKGGLREGTKVKETEV